jgi:adenylyl cyclase-associated protein
MTHKNPELRTTSVVKAEDKPVSASPARGKVAARGVPKCALEGNKWVVVF